ncbi:hypothetical protein BLNAU_21762 [Blattamonas nauphoetae]|uniref:Uncharacterized protein n=1 Tax=Blattamonas nauphoetae TaxID=2049346 RepID=A0ABQ9WV09_9EUKA|nr:hypothetical protein BLNAU_21762 [Blattamonas nauphoetae]
MLFAEIVQVWDPVLEVRFNTQQLMALIRTILLILSSSSSAIVKFTPKQNLTLMEGRVVPDEGIPSDFGPYTVKHAAISYLRLKRGIQLRELNAHVGWARQSCVADRFFARPVQIAVSRTDRASTWWKPLERRHGPPSSTQQESKGLDSVLT